MKLIQLTQIDKHVGDTFKISINPQMLALCTPYKSRDAAITQSPGQRIAPHTWVTLAGFEQEILVVETRSEIEKLLESVR